MIIDAHAHLWSETIPSPVWSDSLVDYGVAKSGSSRERVEERVKEGYFDMSGDMLVEDMDAAGIDKTIVNIIDFGLLDDHRGSPSLEEQHEKYATACENHPDRIDFIGGIDPRRPNAPEFVDMAVDRWDIKALKIHPCSGFYANDRKAYRVYERCRAHDLPVMIHSGIEANPYLDKYARPIYIDDVTTDFPDLDVVIAHAGGIWYKEASSIASASDNVYVDLAYWQRKYMEGHSDNFYRQLRWLIDVVGQESILFGSDWPALRLVDHVNNESWVEIIEELPEVGAEYGLEFTEDEVEGILGNNAENLFYG